MPPLSDGTLPLPTALVVVGFSAVPAWFTYRTVERPLHQSRALAAKPWRAGLVGVVCVLIGLGSAAVVYGSVAGTRSAATPAQMLGAVALGADPTTSAAGIPVDSVDSITPAPVDAGADNADVYADGCHQDQVGSQALSCVYGDKSSSTVIALVGDSHAAQWQPSLRVLAEKNGWRLETYTKSSCLFADVGVWLPDVDRPYPSCKAWTAGVVAKLTQEKPDVVVVSTTGTYSLVQDGKPVPREQSFDGLVSGLTRTWDALGAAGSAVTVLVDTPWPGIDMPECVAKNLHSLTKCAVPRTKAVARSGAALQRAAAARVPGARVVDLTDYVCPRETCAPVIGGVLVFRDTHHLTRTYARSLAPLLEPGIRDSLVQ